MLKVKKKINKNKNIIQNDDISKAQTHLNNSINNLFIDGQKKKKTIDDYAHLTTEIRKEYAKLQNECNELKIQLQKYAAYAKQLEQNSPRKYYQKPIRKRKHYYELQPPESDETEDGSYEEVRRRSKQYRKKKKYEDAIDGIPDYEDEQEDENEQGEDEIEIKKQPIKKKIQPKKI